MTTFTIALDPPLDLRESLSALSRWGDDGIERFDGATVVRTVPVGNKRVAFVARVKGSVSQPALTITLEPGAPDQSVDAIRAIFVRAPEDFVRLRRADAIINRLDRRRPGVRPVLQTDLLLALVRAISAQQVNLRWAATTRLRLAQSFGTRHDVDGLSVYSLDEQRLAETPPAQLRALQFTTRKSEYIVAVARALAEGALSAAALRELADADAVSTLVSVRGVGEWTAEWILVRSLGRARVVAGDLGVRKAVGRAYLDDPLPDPVRVRAATVHWGASAAVAQQLLLTSLAAGDL